MTVIGPVKLNNYTDKNNNIHSVMEIRADEVQFLGKGVETPAENQPNEEDMPY